MAFRAIENVEMHLTFSGILSMTSLRHFSLSVISNASTDFAVSSNSSIVIFGSSPERMARGSPQGCFGCPSVASESAIDLVGKSGVLLANAHGN